MGFTVKLTYDWHEKDKGQTLRILISLFNRTIYHMAEWLFRAIDQVIAQDWSLVNYSETAYDQKKMHKVRTFLLAKLVLLLDLL